MKFFSKRFFKFIVFSMLSFLLCIGITYLYISNRTKLEYTQMEQLAMNKANKVTTVLTKLLYKTEILSAFVQQNKGDVQSFDTLASTIVDDPSIKNVLLAPDGEVKYVYPVSGNESVFGLDFFSDSAGNKEAVLAKETRQLVLGGPFELVQGGQALVGRLPIYIGNENDDGDFWGLASVTLNYTEALLGADLEQLHNQGFAFEIWRISPDDGKRQVIAHSGYSYNKNANYVEYPMELLNAEWYFRLSPIREWYEFTETWLFLIVGAIISMLIGLLVLHNHDLKYMKSELEHISLNDALTGVSNRRGGLISVQKLVDKKEEFILSYIDLNKFKDINDKHGHSSGDNVLKHFANIISSQIDTTNQSFARIGGDEFIVIFKNTNNNINAKVFFDKLNKRLEESKLYIHDEPIEINYSMGYACFPHDGENVDDIIAMADKDMYLSKQHK